jgi:hypothetical protein
MEGTLGSVKTLPLGSTSSLRDHQKSIGASGLSCPHPGTLERNKCKFISRMVVCFAKISCRRYSLDMPIQDNAGAFVFKESNQGRKPSMAVFCI